MKKLTAKYLSLMMLATLLSGTVQAGHQDDGYGNGDCCTRQYECGCNPLYCGAWDLQVQGGVSPITWRNRGPINAVICGSSVTSPVVAIYDTFPNFSKFHKVPWIVGGQVGYHMSDNTRVFVEFDYLQSNGKNDVLVPLSTNANQSVTYSFAKYKLFEGYVGARYYWDRWCDRLSFFLGGKVGFAHHKKQNVDLSVLLTSTAVPFSDVEFNRSNTVISGGGHIGLDYCICGNWSLVLTGEVVASCGPRGVGLINLGTNQNLAGVSSIFTASIGTELRFPVTLAVRYSF
jgi:hypothetical protein